MGWVGEEGALEDTLCADYLRDLLLGRNPDFDVVRDRIRQDPTGQRFFDPGLAWFPEADFDACMDLDRFDYAIVAVADDRYGVCLERRA